MNSEYEELLNKLEFEYYDGSSDLQEFLSAKSLSKYVDYLPIFISGLESNSKDILDFCLHVLCSTFDLESDRIDKEYPYLDEYDFEDYRYDNWLENIMEEKDRTFKSICNIMQRNSVLRQLQSLTMTEDLTLVSDAIQTLTVLASVSYLPNNECVRHLVSIIDSSQDESIKKQCYTSLDNLRLDGFEESFVEDFSEMLINELDNLLLDNLKNVNRNILYNLIFRTNDVLEYLFSNERHSITLLTYISEIQYPQRFAHACVNSRRCDKEKIDRLVLNTLISKGLNENEFASILISKYFNNHFSFFREFSHEEKEFFVHVIFSWSEETSKIIWKVFHYRADIFDYRGIEQYNYYNISEYLKEIYTSILLKCKSTESNRILIDLYHDKNTNFSKNINEKHLGLDKNLQTLIDSISADNSMFVLEFVIQVVRANVGSWSSGLRDRCRSYLNNHPSKKAKSILTDGKIDWNATDDSWFFLNL